MNGYGQSHCSSPTLATSMLCSSTCIPGLARWATVRRLSLFMDGLCRFSQSMGMLDVVTVTDGVMR